MVGSLVHSLLLVEACHLSLPAVRESSQQIASSRVCSATKTVYWTYTSSIVHTRREAIWNSYKRCSCLMSAFFFPFSDSDCRRNWTSLSNPTAAVASSVSMFASKDATAISFQTPPPFVFPYNSVNLSVYYSMTSGYPSIPYGYLSNVCQRLTRVHIYCNETKLGAMILFSAIQKTVRSSKCHSMPSLFP